MLCGTHKHNTAHR
uniref:Uncharacterized protein n=1 Tax=Anguilla anguilla TaxID=7936 RepID=A0A0E9TME4_ANGAN